MANALLYYLIVINILTFAVYGIDKWRSTSGRLLPTGRKKAKQGSWRISEATLLMLAVIGGTIGALLGMQVWRHKTMAPQDEAQEVSHTCMHLLCLAGEASFVFNEHCYHIVKNDLVVIPMPDHISNLAAYIV